MAEVEIVQGICNILREQAGIEVPAPDHDLIDSGLMDSLTFVDMLFQIEERFGVTIDIEKLELDDIRTVTRIGALVSGARA